METNTGNSQVAQLNEAIEGYADIKADSLSVSGLVEGTGLQFVSAQRRPFGFKFHVDGRVGYIRVNSKEIIYSVLN